MSPPSERAAGKPLLDQETLDELRLIHRHGEAHQWKDVDDYARSCHVGTHQECPSCGAWKKQGHRSTCGLQQALLNVGTFLGMRQEALDAAE